jgi:phosphoribosylglycinamide formyltransferase 2
VPRSRHIGLPCVVKPVMSSSGKGQSTVRSPEQVQAAWDYSQQGGRTGSGRVIVEGFVAFDYEITLLTLRHGDRTSFCAPIGHLQIDGDYRESWQPHPMSAGALARAEEIAGAVTDASAAPASSAWSCSCATTRCGSARSRRVRTTPGW